MGKEEGALSAECVLGKVKLIPLKLNVNLTFHNSHLWISRLVSEK